MSNSNPTFLVTGKVRLSFVHLFAPYANPNGGEPKYSTTLLIPKSDIATKQRIDAAIQAAIMAGVTAKWNGVRPAQPKQPVWDGDGLRQTGEEFGPECKGHWVITASSKQAPQVVDMSLSPIINQTEIYSGIYAHVSLNFFPYLNSGNKGIGCGLGNVQKIADGEPLGGRTTAAEDFSAAPSYPQAPPQYTQPPQYVPPVAPVQPQYAPQTQYTAPAQYQQPPAQPQYVPQPQYAPQPQQPQIDPITGQPVIPGGILGLGQ